jgi:hypothetical protein
MIAEVRDIADKIVLISETFFISSETSNTD